MGRIRDSETKTTGRRAIDIIELIGWSFMLYIVYSVLTKLNDERFIENWMLGACLCIVFGTLYVAPKIRLKRIHLFMLTFWFSWFLADFQDYINFMELILF